MEFSKSDWEAALKDRKEEAPPSAQVFSSGETDELDALWEQEMAAHEEEEPDPVPEEDVMTEFPPPPPIQMPEQTEPLIVLDKAMLADPNAVPEEKSTPPAEAAAKHSFTAFEWAEAAIFALIAIAVVFAFGVRTVGVDGSSMSDTLKDGDKLILSSYIYTPVRGDIVVINRENDEPLIKRVIAVAGDKLDINDIGEVVLNGKVLNEPYLDCDSTPRCYFDEAVTIPDGHVFVMGDNRWDSHDSRYSDIGFVDVQEIMGKALWRIAPFDKFGTIYEQEASQ